jgi:hypothetical protein
MNTSTQPPDGAGGSRSKTGELTLGLLSGEKQRVFPVFAFVGARLAREGGGLFNIDATDTPLSQASLLPQVICCALRAVGVSFELSGVFQSAR